MKYQVINGDNISVLKQFPDNHFDSVVTDPPYGIDFLGKTWDANTGALETYTECLRVLKPGGYLLAFSAARTYHHLAVTVEQAGFEIRDQIMWIYSSGFPKSQDIGRSIQRSIGVEQTQPHKNNAPRIGGVAQGEEIKQKEQIVVTDPVAKQWSGWGTCLKPAHEPIVMARKPTKLSFAENVQQWGMGAVNIDAGRVPYDPLDQPAGGDNGWSSVGFSEQLVEKYRDQKKSTKPKVGKMGTTAHENYNAEKNADLGLREGEQQDWIPSDLGRFPSNVIGEIAEPYQKYFYCPKVGRSERHTGFDNAESLSDMIESVGGYCVDENGNKLDKGNHDGANVYLPDIGIIRIHGARHEIEKIRKAKNIQSNMGNNHPTVKPIELMKYLIKLVTPAGGHVLDPFNGSGSTGCAAVELDYAYTGIELDPKYVEIATKRIEAWYAQTHTTTFAELFE